MKVYVVDTETSLRFRGQRQDGTYRYDTSPFDPTMSLTSIGVYYGDLSDPDSFIFHDCLVNHSGSSNGYSATLDLLSSLSGSHMFIGFNAKFDLHWLRRYGCTLPLKVWDCQLGEFVITRQTTRYPSLNGGLERVGLEQKLDVVKTEYWEKGINTFDVPPDILLEYQKHDIMQTYALFLKQLEYLQDKPGMRRVLNIDNQDLLVLQDMEYNGMLIDTDLASQLALRNEQDIGDIDRELATFYPSVPIDWASPTDVSAVIFGGFIHERYRAPKEYVSKKGKITMREVWHDHYHELPALARSNPRNEIKRTKGKEVDAANGKFRVYSVDDDTLQKVTAYREHSHKCHKIIALIRKRRALEKLNSTYYNGIPDLCKEENWTDGRVHPNLNQCVARTCRLSSTNPNMQNVEKGECKNMFISEFE